ncbi:MAG: hypothetical protein AAFP19_24070 [Bacteroidota bacterium]
MIRTRNTNQEGKGPHLVRIVDSLIDSKLQYIDHQQEFLNSTFDELHHMDSHALNSIRSENRLKSIKKKFDEFIEKTEQLTYARELLLLVRTFLKEETAKAIFELLTNDKYLFYTPVSIQRLLGLESYLQNNMAFASDN